MKKITFLNFKWFYTHVTIDKSKYLKVWNKFFTNFQKVRKNLKKLEECIK